MTATSPPTVEEIAKINAYSTNSSFVVILKPNSMKRPAEALKMPVAAPINTRLVKIVRNSFVLAAILRDGIIGGNFGAFLRIVPGTK